VYTLMQVDFFSSTRAVDWNKCYKSSQSCRK